MFQAIHEGLDCKQYQERIICEEGDSDDENTRKTRAWLNVSATKWARSCNIHLSVTPMGSPEKLVVF